MIGVVLKGLVVQLGQGVSRNGGKVEDVVDELGVEDKPAKGFPLLPEQSQTEIGVNGYYRRIL